MQMIGVQRVGSQELLFRRVAYGWVGLAMLRTNDALLVLCPAAVQSGDVEVLAGVPQRKQRGGPAGRRLEKAVGVVILVYGNWKKRLVWWLMYGGWCMRVTPSASGPRISQRVPPRAQHRILGSCAQSQLARRCSNGFLPDLPPSGAAAATPTIAVTTTRLLLPPLLVLPLPPPPLTVCWV